MTYFYSTLPPAPKPSTDPDDWCLCCEGTGCDWCGGSGLREKTQPYTAPELRGETHADRR